MKHLIKLFDWKYLLAVWMLLLWCPLESQAVKPDIEFNYLTNRDGLSNCQVNVILQDNRGYIWMGTQAGLDRFDGFRFKTFLYKNLDARSLPNNSVDEIMQDRHGNLWIHTALGYCLYQYTTETFDRNPEWWLKTKGIDGAPHKMFIDSNKNMWFIMYGRGCHFLNTKTFQKSFFSFADMGMKNAKEVSSITDVNGTAVLSFKDGSLCRLDGLHHRVMWTNRALAKTHGIKDESVYTFVDNRHNYWVLSNSFVYIYSSAQKRWFEGMPSFVKAQGIAMPTSEKVLIRDIAKSKDGRLWIVTDHQGLFILDYHQKECFQYLKEEGNSSSLPDNCLQRIYIDHDGAVWIGTYKSGLAYYSPGLTKFSTIDLGDICTITQDKIGNYWCGTNDSGIVCYNPTTGQRVHFGMAQTGLGSDIVVSSVTMSDGSMYFGTFNGGLVRYQNGQWKAYRQSRRGLAYNSIWALCEDKHHRLVIGTLGSGLQIMDPKTETFRTFDVNNSKIPSNYIASLSPMANGDILVGHSQNVTAFNVDNYKMTNYATTRGGMAFPSPSINDAFADSRGIFWMATPAGICMYDPKTGQLESVNDLNGTQGSVGCSIVEDKMHNIWLVSEYIVSQVKLSKNNKAKWDLSIVSYNSMDGLQEKPYNFRSAMLSSNGDIVIGGQEGINIINPGLERYKKKNVLARFSGLVLFDHPLKAGEEFEGRVVLDKSLDESRVLNLSYKDNAFTIQLASSDVTVPSRNRFLYRMEGVTDKWIMTANGRPEVTFANLPSGSYTLQVKVVNGDGSVCDEISELKINVAPPFYLSIWALMVYILMACGAVYLFRKRALDRQKMAFEREKMEENIRKDKELNELKLNFFTNVSHELRTPLMLIISPLVNIIKNEEDGDKRRKLELVHRNALRLLNMVNQILDFRKIEQNRSKLNLNTVEAVSFIENICSIFQSLGNSKIQLNFESSVSSLIMVFDEDKVGKIINNLLSNAYKFTPDKGSVTVRLSVVKEQKIKGVLKDVLSIQVADTGKGISDEDKAHIFDRFYQVNGTEMQPFGGSGIGLNLVKAFADLHGGKVMVGDNPGGGTVFTVWIPLDLRDTDHHTDSVTPHSSCDATMPSDAQQDSPQRSAAPSQVSASYQTTTAPSPISTASSTDKGQKPVVLLVDDSDDFREFMRDVLSESYTVVEAVNGQEGWSQLKKTRPDIILSDVMMPVMDGNQFCRLVKDTPEYADIPFVLLTARLATEHKKEGYESGADDYITKPFDIDLLNLRIRNLMRRAHSMAHAQVLSVTHGASNPTESVASTSDQLEENANETANSDSEMPEAEKEYVMTENDKRFLESVDIYIRDNMGDPDTTVESMSAHLLISRVQLYKKMVSLTGTTPSEYLRSKRIHWAEQLMHHSDYTISEIAYKVGFNNPRYFSKYFQEEYGMTPSQYKKKLI